MNELLIFSFAQNANSKRDERKCISQRGQNATLKQPETRGPKNGCCSGRIFNTKMDSFAAKQEVNGARECPRLELKTWPRLRPVHKGIKKK